MNGKNHALVPCRFFHRFIDGCMLTRSLRTARGAENLILEKKLNEARNERMQRMPSKSK
jgi:hypothetical protein